MKVSSSIERDTNSYKYPLRAAQTMFIQADIYENEAVPKTKPWGNELAIGTVDTQSEPSYRTLQ